jgi:hypothetical protein
MFSCSFGPGNFFCTIKKEFSNEEKNNFWNQLFGQWFFS